MLPYAQSADTDISFAQWRPCLSKEKSFLNFSISLYWVMRGLSLADIKSRNETVSRVPPSKRTSTQ